jgi:hypothetical protein
MRRKKQITPVLASNDAPTIIPNQAPPRIIAPLPSDEAPSWLPISFIALGAMLLLISCIVLIAVGLWVMQGEEKEEGTQEADVSTPSTPPTATIFVVGNMETSPTETATLEPSPTSTATSTSAPSATPAGPTLTYTFVPPTRIPASATSTPTRTLLPTNTLEATTPPPTSSVRATAAFTAFPTNTPDPLSTTPFVGNDSVQSAFANTVTPTSSLPAPIIEPTQLTQQGRQIRLFYDVGSFYLWNPTSERILLDDFVFEAIDSTGLSTGYTFEGTRWSDYYEYVEPGNCVSIEITTAATWLRPRQCSHYNAIVTPQNTNPMIFWTARSGISEFRVLWKGEELTRCQIGGVQCDVFLP